MTSAKALAIAMLMAYDEAPTVESGLASTVRLLADSLWPNEPEPRWWQPVRQHHNRALIRTCLLAIASELEDGELV
jgi:hypothetical protein